jgi:hypothetical protein
MIEFGGDHHARLPKLTSYNRSEMGAVQHGQDLRIHVPKALTLFAEHFLHR